MKFTDYGEHQIDIASNGWFVCTALDKKAEKYSELTSMIDKYDANKERQKKAKVERLPVLVFHSNISLFDNESKFFASATSGAMERSKYGAGFDVWITYQKGKETERKKVSSNTIFLDNEHNKPIAERIEVITRQRDALNQEREELLKTMEKIKPPEGIQ